MAQTIQIVPKFSFPYVETIINDYTLVGENTTGEGNIENPVIRFIFPFVSSKGIDNRFIRKRTRENVVAAYGETNFKKYGQPLMQALNVADSTNTEVWCMRVMPENAAYAHNIISGYFKGDTAEDVSIASARKFRIKFTQKQSPDDTPIISTNQLTELAAKLDGTAIKGVYRDGEGYTQVPGLVTLYSSGRGKYGDDYRVRIGQDIYYEKDYGIKFYDFEVLSTESGLKKEANYIGSVVTSSKYENTTLINDVLDDTEDGMVPVMVNFNEDAVETIYNEYVDWATALVPDLQAELSAKLKDYQIPDGMVEGTIPVTSEYKEKVEEILRLMDLISTASNVPNIDEFDIIFGRKVASTESIPFIYYPTKLTADIDTSADDYDAKDYTQSDIVTFDSVQGVKLMKGSDGYFENPRTTEVDLPAGGTEKKQWTVEDEIELCYIKAFSGEYDRRILTPKRIKANALWDANYTMPVKYTMADLAIVRNDGICYLDCGIRSSLSMVELNQMIKDYSVFQDYKISKNLHHYYVKEPTSKKRVPVTITYFLSKKYIDHILNYGGHVPFVKSYAQLEGHIKDSLYPTVEDYETDMKETLHKNRFNYFITVDDNVYQRDTQNTAQTTTSDLLEESNVTTLYEMKRIIERDINDRMYDFAYADARQRFRNYEIAKFADWSNKEVESFSIDFRMNAWESERSILHCYMSVVFRGLQKRAILEIDVNKRTYAADTTNLVGNVTSTTV